MEAVAAGLLMDGSAGAVLHGELELGYCSAVIITSGGGNNEIQREIILVDRAGISRTAVTLLRARAVDARDLRGAAAADGDGAWDRRRRSGSGGEDPSGARPPGC